MPTPRRLVLASKTALLALIFCAPLACQNPAGTTPGGGGADGSLVQDGQGGGPGGKGGGAGKGGSGGAAPVAGAGGGGSGGGEVIPDAGAIADSGDPIDDPDPSATPDGGPPADDGGSTTPPSPKTPTPSEACASGKAAPMAGSHTLDVGGKQRRFIIRLPEGYDGKKPWPVIFAFHGAGGQDATTFDTKFGFRAENGSKAVLVFPEALARPQGGRSWMIDTAANMAFMDALIAWLKSNVCLDSSRLFATGQSSGGYFSQTLGCQRGHVFRAVAPSSGGYRDFDNCMGNPGVWMSYGKMDGAALLSDVKKAIDFWFTRKGCSREGPKPVAPAPCVAHAACKDHSPINICSHGGGHPWPDYATKGVWTFFSQF